MVPREKNSVDSLYHDSMGLPRLLPVRQKFPDRRIQDIPAAVERELAASGFASRVKPGGRVALGVGSRGIANISTIVGSVVRFWKSNGFDPFIFPAMGSHGAATAEGQAGVLAHYGIYEATMGCPVVSSLDVVPMGASPDGIAAFMDRNAFESGAIMPIGRIKWHTDFAGTIESGLLKMIAIGLGKFAGAQRYHTHAHKLGLQHVIRGVAQPMLASGKILGGLAILEDANHNTAQLTAVPADTIVQSEEELLALVKSWMGSIPIPELDVLILDEIGKNISGAGMDTKVVNRSVHGGANTWPGVPRIERLYVRDLSSLSYGNAVGIGLADIVHERILGKIDWNATRINSLTASTPTAIRMPIHYPSDRECLDRIAPTCGKLDLSQVTYGWVRNSLELSTLALSENLRAQIEADPMLEIIGPPQEFEFDATGDLGACPAAEALSIAH